MFAGSLVALITPMKTDGQVDLEALRQLVEWQIDQGSDAIVILGTTGESPAISFAERELIIKETIAQAAKRIPIIVGTGTNATNTTIDLTKHAMSLGADASLLVVPYYNRPTQAGLLSHFTRVASEVAMPHILYNHPFRTGCDMLPETVISLAKLSNIVGIKEAITELDRVHALLNADSLDIYSGDDAFARELILAGGKGVISVIANIMPKKMHDMAIAALSGDKEKSQQLDNDMSQMYDLLGAEVNPIPVKWALHEMGKVQAGIRSPLMPLSGQYIGAMQKGLLSSGLAGEK